MTGLSVQSQPAGECRWKPRQDFDWLVEETWRSTWGIRYCWQHAGTPYLIDSINAVTAATFADIESVLKNRKAAEVVAFSRLIGSWRRRISGLSDLKISEHIDMWRDRRGKSGQKQFGASRIDQVLTDLGAIEL